MKTFIISIITLFFFIQLSAQLDQQVADYFKSNPEADANGDGKLTREEARAHRQKARQPQQSNTPAERDPSQGDNLVSTSHIPGIDIPESISPVKEVKLKSADGVDLSFAYRTPPGKGPHPTILFFHGGGGQSNLQGLKNNLLTQPIQTRFLEKGFITIASTRRAYWKGNNESPTGFYDAVNDAALIVEKAKTLPGVDADKVILYGGSGGAILAIVTASKTDLACVIAGEPATVVPLDPRTGQSAGTSDYRSIMENPQELFTSQRQLEMRAWMKEITCPVLVLQGNHVGLYKTNFEILIPEMKKLGKDISSISYPGVTHGFYWGTTRTGATLETVEQIMKDVTGFINEHRAD
ncbi:MAG: hypothetical protein O3C43_00955 [Verrucomicrobia bacterium]|nr:hypothetical protein [Verrucomicrobiota bacterium]MDA1065047.1 hypothetical protein [Verrucomicrobiota bacterium]